MKFTAFAATFALLAAAVSAASDTAQSKRTPPTKLQIGVKFRPESCPIKASIGDKVAVHYQGTLFDDGTKFDDSYERGQPIEFTLGQGQVIKGWDQGILGMCIGEKRVLKIPADLGYGANGAGGVIPPNAALVFKTELVAINGKGKDAEDDAGREEL
ncbi:Peptidyl-prolyl cis-trans isomerase fpr2 [Linderina macrospora]|uniref:Peptidyl-prolyl cis-trans isomerase fpr2 n=1 Tax=Linderina macrospora TaxID=4868 RepID=A0ACC1J7E9_9FUNG|nr:Peptidyl-prolyl cis-trans isomerase fpr2 [Linderina macrospora]